MRVVTWNVNGLRSLIRCLGNIDKIFSLLDSDIVCFQVGAAFSFDVRKVAWEYVISIQTAFQRGMMRFLPTVRIMVDIPEL